MSIHSGIVGISTRIYDLEPRLLGANSWANQPGDQEETYGRESTCKGVPGSLYARESMSVVS